MSWRVLMACCRVASPLDGLTVHPCTPLIAVWMVGRTEALLARYEPSVAMAAAPGGWVTVAEGDVTDDVAPAGLVPPEAGRAPPCPAARPVPRPVPWADARAWAAGRRRAGARSARPAAEPRSAARADPWPGNARPGSGVRAAARRCWARCSPPGTAGPPWIPARTA